MVLVVRVFVLGMFVLLAVPAASASVLLNPPMVPPSPPMDVHASTGTDGVTITWQAPLSTGGASDVTYRVYKDSALIADGLTSTVYVDSLASGASATQSSYQVTAVNEAGESGQACVCASLSPPNVDPVSCAGNAIALVWWVISQTL